MKIDKEDEGLSQERAFLKSYGTERTRFSLPSMPL